MLVLSRKAGERIVIDDEIVVTVVSATGGRVKLGISAPEAVAIRRGELSGGPRQNADRPARSAESSALLKTA